ncbi:MAG: cytochrome P460 family protein [Spirochaetales bacterium]|nr:cytochrome P460 family protein [Spirochaetales bacterium]
MKKLFIALFIFVIISTVIYAGGNSEDATPTQTSEFINYSSWAKVNAETITGDVTGVLGAAHERSKGFREIYVNEIGLPVESGEEDYPFPEGTIIVKESFKNDKGSKGALSNLTVMVKRESGYSPDYGDWEYIITKPDGAIAQQGTLSVCIKCHARGEDKDYTFINSSM